MPKTTQTSFFDDFANYLEALVEQLLSEGRQAAILENSPVVGGDREEIYRRFPERHLPKNCEVFRGGYVFNINGDSSKQLDVIVTSGLAPRFQMGSGKQAIAPIEGTIAVVEVKSKLNKKELKSTLDSFREIPLSSNMSFNPSLRVSEERKWDIPYKILFAYDGIKKENSLKYLNQYYINNPAIPQQCKPSLIHVLGKYALVRSSSGMIVLDPDGTPAKQQPIPGQYWWFNRKSDMISMIHIFTTIQGNSFLSNHVMVDYDAYKNQIADVILKRPW